MKEIFCYLILMFIAVSMNAQITFQKAIGGINDDDLFSGMQTSDSGYIMTGFNGNGSPSNLLLTKLNSTGTLIWKKTLMRTNFNLGNGYCVKQTNDGGYAVLSMFFD